MSFISVDLEVGLGSGPGADWDPGGLGAKILCCT